MLVGYARVSDARTQDLAVQEGALKNAGCERVFSEKRSGREADSRPVLQEAIAFCRSGDTILVTRLDRWARSTRDLHNLLAALDEKGVGFRCIAQPEVDTTTPGGKLTLAVLGAVASFELDLRAQRVREGIEKAKLVPGKYVGRKPSIDYGQVQRLHQQGIRPSEIATLMKIGRTSVYRALMGNTESA